MSIPVHGCLSIRPGALTDGYKENTDIKAELELTEEVKDAIRNIIGAAIDVHRELGPGYLEKVYEQAMALELRHRGLAYATQVSVAVHYKGEKIQ